MIVEYIPLLVRRGDCASKKKLRSLLSGAGGEVAHTPCFTSAFRSVRRERPPRPLRLRWLRDIFLMSRPALLTRRGICLNPNFSTMS